MEFDFKTLEVNISGGVATVSFNRPDKANALNQLAWDELQTCFETLDELPEARVIILNGKGKHFCSGIDISLLLGMQQKVDDKCGGRKAEKLRKVVLGLQAPINAIEKCSKPVLAVIHGGCIGGGLDIAAACDMRYCSSDAYFSIKEADMGLVADLGTLQRLPKLIGSGIVKEMAYTARNVGGAEAQEIHLVNKCYESAEVLQSEVLSIANNIAGKSPLVIRGTKEMLNYAQDHTVADGLNYVATWNAATILSEDLAISIQAQMTKKTPVFRD